MKMRMRLAVAGPEPSFPPLASQTASVAIGFSGTCHKRIKAGRKARSSSLGMAGETVRLWVRGFCAPCFSGQ